MKKRTTVSYIIKLINRFYDHPPVSLWKSSSFRVWLASFDLIDRKMYPPINSCMTLQSAERQLKSILLSSSNWIVISLTSQLTFQACQNRTKIEVSYTDLYYFKYIPSSYCISRSLSGHQCWYPSALFDYWLCLGDLPSSGRWIWR